MANKILELNSYIKLARLIFEGGAIALRGFLRFAAKKNNPPGPLQIGFDDVSFYRQQNQKKWLDLTKNDLEKFKGDDKDWDVISLRKLLNGLFKKEIEMYKLQTHIKTIYDNRNILAHKNKTTVDKSEFALLYNNTAHAIESVIGVLGFDSEERRLMNTLHISLTEGNFDIVSTLDSILKLTDGDSIYKEIRCNLEEVTAALDKYGTPEMRDRALKSVKDLFERICMKWDKENEHLLHERKRDFKVGLKLRIQCDDSVIVEKVMQLLDIMFQEGSISDLHSERVEKAVESLQIYIKSLYRTENVNTEKGSIVLVLRCKKLRSIAEVIECVKDEDLLEHLQEISKAVSEELKADISLQADLQEDIIRRTLEEIENAESSEITKPSEEISKCNLHPSMEIEHFCEKHEVLLCNECIPSKHETCEISNLESKVANLDGRTENTLRKIIEEKMQLKGLTKESDDCFDEFADMERQHREYLAEMTKDFEKKLAKTRNELKMKLKMEKINLNDKMNEEDDKMDELEKHTKTLEQMKDQPDKKMIFISEQKVKEISSKVKDVKDELLQIKKKKDTLKPLPKYKDAKDLAELIDKVEEISVVAGGKRSLYNVSAKICERLIEKESWITGSLFLEDGVLVLANAQTPELLLYDKDFKLLQSIPTTSKPWEITLVLHNEIIVTFPQEKKLAIYKVSDRIVFREDFGDLDKNCYGVCVNTDAIYVTCHDKDRDDDHAEILVLSLHDKSKKDEFKTGNVSLKWPRCVRINKNKTKLFVSDWKTDYVHCFDLAKECVLFSYTDIEIKRPMGLCIDELDNVLVCCGRSDSIYIIHKDGRKGKLAEVPELACPNTVTYRHTDGKLVIGMWNTRQACIVYNTQ